MFYDMMYIVLINFSTKLIRSSFISYYFSVIEMIDGVGAYT